MSNTTQGLGHDYDYEAARCIKCDCRPWGRWAELPCGTTTENGVPPQPLTANEFAMRAVGWATAFSR